MFRIGLENNLEGRSLAWVLGQPGCFAYATTGTAALAEVPSAIHAYRRWISNHTSESWFPPQDIDYQLEETWECYTINDDFELAAEGYEVNAWFRYDWKPLTDEEVRHGLALLDWGRTELLQVVSNLGEAALNRMKPGERWSITGVLKHVAGAEWWYLDRLGLAFPREGLPGDPFERLEKVRSCLIETLPGLVGTKRVVGVAGEFWSPGKLLRRAVWHEYDHIEHIRKLI